MSQMDRQLIAKQTGRKRLLVFDVDGTLTNSQHEITPATRRAVARVQAGGIRVMLATGRRYRDVLPVAQLLGISGPLVTASGALVKEPADHRTLFQAGFAPGVLSATMNVVVAAGLEPILYTNSFESGFDFYCRTLEGAGGLGEYLCLNRSMARVFPLLDQNLPGGVFAGFVMGARPQMLALEAALDAAFPGQLSLHTIRSPRYRDWMCEIAPAGVTKWSGVLPVAAAWGIQPAEICAVGDDLNDLSMILGAGLGIAMGNAQPGVLAIADQIVATHDEDGIGQIVDLLLAETPHSAPFGGTVD